MYEFSIVVQFLLGAVVVVIVW